MKWEKIEIKNDNGETVFAQAPVIISASRSTDIPAFYSDWFIQRIQKGYLKWKNPFNGEYLYVSFGKTRLIVFWSKNPKPMLLHLDHLDEKSLNYYFQYTLNDYENEKYEPNVPSIHSRIDTFIKLSERIGKEKVIWRFDPLILSDKIGLEELLRKVENIGNQLNDYTDKLVISFADINLYKKVQNNLKKYGINYQEFNEIQMHEFAKEVQKLNQAWYLEIATCAEKIDLKQFGIEHNKCIDDRLMKKVFNHDKDLMEFLGVEIKEPTIFDTIKIIDKGKKLKDKGQREDCGCIVSKDIGEYNTCPHECVYCYANTSIEIAKKNFQAHKINPLSETIVSL